MASEGGLTRSALLVLSTQLTLTLTPPTSPASLQSERPWVSRWAVTPSKGKENANKGRWEEEEEEKRERSMKTSREVMLKPAVFLSTTPSAGRLKGAGRRSVQICCRMNNFHQMHQIRSDLLWLYYEMLKIFCPHIW